MLLTVCSCEDTLEPLALFLRFRILVTTLLTEKREICWLHTLILLPFFFRVGKLMFFVLQQVETEFEQQRADEKVLEW